MKSNVIKLASVRRPKSYTTPEALIEEVRKGIFGDKFGYKDIADRCKVSTSTIHNLASGKTRWPRPTTLFPLLQTLGLELRIVKKDPK